MTRTSSRLIRGAVILGAIFAVGFLADVSPSTWQSRGTIISQAEAVVGRPGTPRSAAGVRRRTTRHVRRR
ncbi:hypothetical protein SAMN05519103_09101 [Rhizobiales bacterium GAS113]|nr:hypothetical protein SAMN05519103_09101 [Rhizobiales bacterium GAS113]